MKKQRLGVLISGGGSNLQAIIDACSSGVLKDIAEVAVVISNKPDAYGIERARKHDIPAVIIQRREFNDAESFGGRILKELDAHRVDIVCLAGYLLMLDKQIVAAYAGRILNIHPALLPRYGGKGMYGHHVHEAVVAAGETESGATVHIVDEEYDHGCTVVQRKVALLPGDTPEMVAKRVLEIEHRIFPEAIKILIEKQNRC